MADAYWQFFTAAELKAADVRITASDTVQDALIEKVCQRSTRIVEDYLGIPPSRHLVADSPAATITEYHSVYDDRARIWLLQRPIIDIVNVYEDESRSYSVALTEDSDFVASLAEGKLTRVSGSALTIWRTGFRVIKAQYKASYATAEGVPSSLVDVAMRLATMIYREIDRQKQGITSFGDAGGNVTTEFSTVHLTPAMRQALDDSGLSMQGLDITAEPE